MLGSEGLLVCCDRYGITLDRAFRYDGWVYVYVCVCSCRWERHEGWLRGWLDCAFLLHMDTSTDQPLCTPQNTHRTQLPPPTPATNTKNKPRRSNNSKNSKNSKNSSSGASSSSSAAPAAASGLPAPWARYVNEGNADLCSLDAVDLLSRLLR